MAVTGIVRRSTTVRETETTTLVAVAEAQEAIIEAGDKASEEEGILTVKAVEVNLASIETTDLLRVLVEVEGVAEITRGSRATTTLAVDRLLAKGQLF